MFLHLGGDVIIPMEDVIVIMDLQSSFKTETNREFLENAETEEYICEITDKSKAKSLIIATDGLYLSPISSVTLKKRSEEVFSLSRI